MTAKDPATLKALFENGDVPNGTNFTDLMDSYLPATTSASFSTNANATFTGNLSFSGTNSYTGGQIFASYIRTAVQSSVAATGTTQGSAKSISGSTVLVVKSVTSATENGLLLGDGKPGYTQIIINTTTASAKLYPPSGGVIDDLASDAARDILPSSRTAVYHITSALFYTLRGA